MNIRLILLKSMCVPHPTFEFHELEVIVSVLSNFMILTCTTTDLLLMITVPMHGEGSTTRAIMYLQMSNPTQTTNSIPQHTCILGFIKCENDGKFHLRSLNYGALQFSFFSIRLIWRFGDITSPSYHLRFYARCFVSFLFCLHRGLIADGIPGSPTPSPSDRDAGGKITR